MCIYIIYMHTHMSVLPTCMFLYHLCVWCLWRSEQGIRSLKLGAVEECKMPLGAET